MTAAQPAASLSGLLRFARYAFMPNRLGYCGGEDNRAPYDYAVASTVDRGLAELAVEARQLYDHLAERFTTQLSGRARELVLGKAPAGARPHHSFHVLDVYTRTGDAAHTLGLGAARQERVARQLERFTRHHLQLASATL